MPETGKKAYKRKKPDDQEKHLYSDDDTAAIERVRRKLLRLMVISIVITILLVGAVLIAVIYKINRPAQEPAAASALTSAPDALDVPDAPAPLPEPLSEVVEGEIILPTGTRLLSQSLSGHLISLETLQPNGGTELIVYDYQAKRIVARLRIPAEKAAELEEPQDQDSVE